MKKIVQVAVATDAEGFTVLIALSNDGIAYEYCFETCMWQQLPGLNGE
jgi:hypothetical protein